MVQYVFLTVGWIFIVATALPFLKSSAWWIRIFDYPRSQIAVGSILVWLTLFTLAEPGPIRAATLIVLGGAAAYQLWEMSKYTPLRRATALPPESSDPYRRVRFLIGNVLMTNRRASDYLDMIRREAPDIVLLAEPDEWWEDQLRPLEDAYPHRMRAPLSNTYGMLLYSKLPLSGEQIRYLVEPDVPSFHAICTLPAGDEFELHCVHPRPPQAGSDTDERDAELVLVAKQISQTERPVVVSGDLNDVAWSHTTRLFLRISKMLDPRVGRRFCNTFPVGIRLFRWPLDHLFHSRAFRLARLERKEPCGSDHFPVLVELSYEPEVRQEQERPQATSADHEEAKEKLEQVGR